MANSTSNIDQIASSQAAKEVVVNALIDAASPSTALGRHASTCAGLVWGYYGGTVLVSSVPTQIANGTLTLTASNTNYIRLSSAGAVSTTTSAPAGWPGPLSGGFIALYSVVTGASSVTSWTDYRLAETAAVAGASGATGNTGATGGTGIGPTGGTGSTGANWTVSVNAQTGTGYSLQSTDNGVVVTLNNAGAITLTVPSGLGANFACEVIQLGSGQVTVTPSSTTVNAYGGLTKLAGQHAAATLVAYTANVFNLSGNLSA